MADTTDIPSFTDREIPKLEQLALSEVSECLKKRSKYMLYFLTKVPTTIYQKIRDKVVPEIYLNAEASTNFEIKQLLKGGCSQEAYRFAEIWIQILEKSSVIDKVALFIHNSKSLKQRTLGSMKKFDIPANLIQCISTKEETFVVEGKKFKEAAKHPNMFIATVAEEPIERKQPIMTEAHLEEIKKTPKDKIREKLIEYLNPPPEFSAMRKIPPHHFIVNKMDLQNDDALYIAIYNTNMEKHTFVYTGLVVLKDIMLLDALYTDQELFPLWYS